MSDHLVVETDKPIWPGATEPKAILKVASSTPIDDAGVSIDEFIGLVTVARQITSREGAVIGNFLKTIFTRLERGSTRDSEEILKRNIVCLRRYAQECFPGAVNGQVHFVRLLMESVADELAELTPLLKIGDLAVQAHKSELIYEAHCEDAVACGYDNDPTGSIHLKDSYDRSAADAAALRAAIDAVKETEDN